MRINKLILVTILLVPGTRYLVQFSTFYILPVPVPVQYPTRLNNSLMKYCVRTVCHVYSVLQYYVIILCVCVKITLLWTPKEKIYICESYRTKLTLKFCSGLTIRTFPILGS